MALRSECKFFAPVESGDNGTRLLRWRKRLGNLSDVAELDWTSPHGAKMRAARLAAMRLSRGLIRARIKRIDPSSGGDDFKQNVAAGAVSLTDRVQMKKSITPPRTQEPAKHDLPLSGFVRLTSILAPRGPIPVGRSTWWAGVKSGRFPKPVKLGPRTTAWKVEDIRDLIEKAS